MNTPIPPDPEDMNDERSEWAEQALDLFIGFTGCDEQDALCDLLANLAHLCDRKGWSMENELRRARMHYKDETENQGTQF